MSATGCFVLHLYCDHPQHDLVETFNMNYEFTGRISTEAWREARMDGWLRKKAGGEWKVTCPACRNKGPIPPSPPTPR